MKKSISKKKERKAWATVLCTAISVAMLSGSLPVRADGNEINKEGFPISDEPLR